MLTCPNLTTPSWKIRPEKCDKAPHCQDSCFQVETHLRVIDHFWERLICEFDDHGEKIGPDSVQSVHRGME